MLQVPGEPCIELYTGSQASGRKYTVSGRCVSNLEIDAMKGKVSSCKITEGTWMLYGELSYQGQVTFLKPGTYDTKYRMGLKSSETVASMRPFPPKAENSILLFQFPGFRGRMVHLTESLSDPTTLDLEDVSSAIVVSGSWTVCDNEGKTLELTEGYHGGVSGIRIPSQLAAVKLTKEMPKVETEIEKTVEVGSQA